MPFAPKTHCRYPGCPKLSEKNGYCDKHSKQISAEYDRQRGTPSERGYDVTWVKLRTMHLSEEPLCRYCKKTGLIIEATEVHHIIPIRERPDLRLVDSNLASACKPCHSTLTMQEINRSN
jgi:5-methylcytosine-specific restriction enzyme A